MEWTPEQIAGRLRIKYPEHSICVEVSTDLSTIQVFDVMRTSLLSYLELIGSGIIEVNERRTES